MTTSGSQYGQFGFRLRTDLNLRSGAAIVAVAVGIAALSSMPAGQGRDEADLSVINRIRQEARRSE